MRKLLYIASAPIDFENPSGVAKKMLDQSVAFKEAGFGVDIIYRNHDSIFMYNLASEKNEYLCKGKSVLSVLNRAKRYASLYKNVYIRYPKSTPLLVSLVKKFKHNGAKIVIEIPTYPYHKEGTDSIKGRIIAQLDKIYRKKLYKHVDRVCTYSADNEIFNIKTIRTINGIDFSRFVPDTTIVPKEDINLIAVSSMYRVHGYDRLIEGMSNYYKDGGLRNIYLHIVGKGDVDKEYKELVSRRNLGNNIFFYGARYGQELMDIYKGQNMGVNSLAIHRQELTMESTLKTKEYTAMGLPIISSSYVDAFSEEANQKFVFRIPPDETPVDVASLVKFIDDLYNSDLVDLRNAIRDDAKRICDMLNTLKPIITYYECEEN